jgi:hypothetical protein
MAVLAWLGWVTGVLHTHLFWRRSPFLLKLGGRLTRDETTVRADLVKKFCAR